MADLRFTIYIDGPTETIFALIADITRYDLWLPRSGAFSAITQVSPIPIGLDTTYIDSGPSGIMHGSITEYQPSTRITFQQSMPIKLLLVTGILELHIHYTLDPIEKTTRVNREVSFHPDGLLKAAQPLISATVRRESNRLLQALKRYVESRPEHDRQ